MTWILFLVIFIVNLVFWVSWIRLMFNTTYEKIKDFVLRRICKGRFGAASIGQGDANEIDLINEEKLKKIELDEMAGGPNAMIPQIDHGFGGDDLYEEKKYGGDGPSPMGYDDQDYQGVPHKKVKVHSGKVNDN